MDEYLEIDEYIKKKRYRQINSVVVMRDDEIIIEKYFNGCDRNHRNVIRSVAKSIMSISCGICLDKGIIKSLDEPIADYLPEFNEGKDVMHKAITIRNLLTMTSGIYWIGGIHYHCPLLNALHRSSDWVEYISETAVTSVPGTVYNYSEFDVILLVAILEKAIGSDYFDFLNENLYKMLGIKSGRWYKGGGVYYSVGHGGAGNGGAEEKPSNLTAREMLKIGQLFLNDGVYNGKRIISSEYIHEAVAPSYHNKGYGYLWWIGDGFYGCRGFGGQNITVIPDKKAVIVIQATPTARGMEYDDVIDLIREILV